MFNAMDEVDVNQADGTVFNSMDESEAKRVDAVAKMFRFQGRLTNAEPFGNGHINDTYALTYNDGGTIARYILQRVNTDVFKEPVVLMENILRVTGHISKKISQLGGDLTREMLNVIKTCCGGDYLDNENGFWRAYYLLENTTAYDQAANKEMFRESAVAFGRFQKLLADFPADALHESIPDFHNTKKRYDALEAAIKKDAAGRAAQVADEIAFARKRKAETSVLTELQEAGKLPLRVTHNDTKLNNVLFDKDSGKAVCVIDLDTVMPGLAILDFGDSIRFGASTAVEDEKDLSKVTMSLELFKMYAEGFLSEARDSLTATEIEYMAFAAKIITYECGIRFLTDYLNGDKYFKISYPEHNLDRCRTQFKLVADMESKADEMNRIINELAKI